MRAPLLALGAAAALTLVCANPKNPNITYGRNLSIVIEARTDTPPLSCEPLPAVAHELCSHLGRGTFATFTAGSSLDTPNDDFSFRTDKLSLFSSFVGNLKFQNSVCFDYARDFLCWWLFPPCVEVPLDDAFSYTWTNVANISEVRNYTVDGEIVRQPLCRDRASSRIVGLCPEMLFIAEQLDFPVEPSWYTFGDDVLQYGFASEEINLPYYSLLHRFAVSYWNETNDGTWQYQSFDNNRHNVSCYLLGESTEAALAACPLPLTRGMDPEQPTECVVSCPARVFESVGNTGRQDALDVLALVSATLGLVIASLVFATWLLRKNLRQFPSRFTMFFAGALFLFSLAFLLPVPKCLNEAMPTATKYPNYVTDIDTAAAVGCGFQGSLFVFGSLAMSAWWCCFCIALYYLIVYAPKHGLSPDELRRHEWKFHVAGWLPPFVCTVVMLATAGVRYNEGSMTCFISNADGALAQILLFVGPHCVYFTLGAVAMCSVLYATFVSSKAVQSWDTFRAAARFATFVPLYFMPLAVLLAYFMLVANISSEIDDAVSDFRYCYLDKQSSDSLVAISKGDTSMCPDGMDIKECVVFLDGQLLEGCRASTLGSLFSYGLDVVARLCMLSTAFLVFFVFWWNQQNRAWFILKITCGRVNLSEEAVDSQVSTASARSDNAGASSRRRFRRWRSTSFGHNRGKAKDSVAGTADSVELTEADGEAGGPQVTRDDSFTL